MQKDEGFRLSIHSGFVTLQLAIDTDLVDMVDAGRRDGAPKVLRGFAAMSREKVVQIARLGGIRRSKQIGPDGFAALGRKGGRMRAGQMDHAGYVSMGQRGGLNRGSKPPSQEV